MPQRPSSRPQGSLAIALRRSVAVLSALLLAPALVGAGDARAEAEAGADDRRAAPILLAQADADAAGGEDASDAEEESAGEDFEYEDEGDVEPPAGVEVFRVKGRGVSAIETDVPTSVTQFDAAAIEALGAQNVSDLAQVTPNVEIRTAGATTPTFFVRGVGLADFNANAAGAVAIYQDDVPINAPAAQLGLLFDLVNVEVERGPQGTGLARNGSAGAIRIASRRPTGQLSANFRASYGNYNFHDFTGALELPLLEEQGLSMRTSFRYSGRDGFMRNGCGGGPSQAERLDGTLLSQTVNTGTLRPVLQLYAVDPSSTTAGWYVHGDNSDVPASPITANLDGKHCGEDTPITIYDRPGFANRQALVRVSRLPEDLPDEFGERKRWALRNIIAWEPEDLDMVWMAKGYFSRLDEDTVLAQVSGTTGGQLGGETNTAYSEPDDDVLTARAFRKFPDDLSATPDERRIEGEKRSQFISTRLARNLDARPRRGDYNRPGPTELDTWGASLKGDFQIDAFELRVLSSYDGYDRHRVSDADATPNIVFENETDDDAWQFYQEVSLKGESEEEPFRWNLGAYYLMEELDNDAENFSITNDIVPQNRRYEQNTWSVGAFAGMEWDFLDDFTLESGIRYNWERKQFDHALITAVTPPIDNQEETWEAPTGVVVLRYRFHEDASAYWKYSRGWKPGHFNASASLAREVTSAKPEKIDSWEIGLRGSWLDRRVSMGIATFYYRYENYQVFIINSDLNALPAVEVVNADDAQIYGLELDFRVEPLDGYIPPEVDGLAITGRFGWLESQFLDFQVESFDQVLQPAPTPGDPPTIATTKIVNDYSGNRLINSPQFSFSLSVEWTFDFGRWGQIVPLYDYIWSDEVYFAQTEGRGVVDPQLVPPRSRIPKHSVGQKATATHNLRLSYRLPQGNIEVSGFVRNLTDETVRRQGFDASIFAQELVSFVGEPRTYGVDVAFEW